LLLFGDVRAHIVVGGEGPSTTLCYCYLIRGTNIKAISCILRPLSGGKHVVWYADWDLFSAAAGKEVQSVLHRRFVVTVMVSNLGDLSDMGSSTSSRDGDDLSHLSRRLRRSLPVPLYSTYHGEDSEAEVEEELRERENDYGFRASSESSLG
jgi:hypothetical protein